MKAMHLTGAGLAFGGGIIYQVLDTTITYKMCPDCNGRTLLFVRTTIVITGICSFITCILDITQQNHGSKYSMKTLCLMKL